MSVSEIREEIMKSWSFAIKNDMQDPVIRLYISKEDDICIWNEKGYFHFSTGSWKYDKLDDLLDELCKEIVCTKKNVLNIEIE